MLRAPASTGPRAGTHRLLHPPCFPASPLRRLGRGAAALATLGGGGGSGSRWHSTGCRVKCMGRNGGKAAGAADVSGARIYASRAMYLWICVHVC